MEILQDNPQFRPVTIKIDRRDDYDKLTEIISAVAENRINHRPQLVIVAKDLLRCLSSVELED